MLLDWLFAPRCAACGGPGFPLCEPCAGSLLELGPACIRCAEPVGEHAPATCRRCTTQPLPLEQIVTPWRFGGQLATAIRRLKFTHHAHVARELAPLWAPLLAAVVEERDAIVVPVPLHWRRRFTRGYDHAWLLAVHGCRAAALPPPRPVLRRARAAPAQSTLPAAARRANLHGAFVVRPAHRREVAGKICVLVDDVVTTGSTMAAAAHPLLAAGAASVIGVALARSM